MNTSSQHPDDFLAFYVNGTLTDDEQDKVESHLGGCERCQKELALLRTMRDVTRQQQEKALPQEFAWQRLKRDIKQQDSTSIASRSRAWWKPAIGIAAALIMTLQAVFIFNLKNDIETYGQAGYQYGGVVMQIKVNPKATEAQLRELLLKIDAEIVSGPSAAGLYRIRLSDQKNDPEVAEKIKALKDHDKLILYVGEE